MTTLEQGSKTLLKPFVHWLGVHDYPDVGSLQIEEQRIPGSPIATHSEVDAKGLPDGVIFDSENWAVVIECKVQAKLQKKQLTRHRDVMQRNGFDKLHILAITVNKQSNAGFDDCILKTWSEVYEWFGKMQVESEWARHFVQYMRVFEQKAKWEDYAIEGTITVFDGFLFSDENPYTYREIKRILNLLRQELIESPKLIKLGVDPAGKGRGAITGKESKCVWDFLSLKSHNSSDAFTSSPHLTLWISESHCSASITIPNGIKGGFKSHLKSNEKVFYELLRKIEKQLRPLVNKSKGAVPWMYVLQQHFLSQRSTGVIDGRIGADLRTIVDVDGGIVKFQSEWAESIYRLLTNKRSNMQFGIEMQFKYDCPIMQSKKAVDLFADTFVAISPLLDFVSEIKD